ncbi:hypothetical protein [Megalodesulfovibrio paquesii]
MPRRTVPFLLPFLLMLALAGCLTTPALALSFRVLLITPERELRSARLVVQGRSTLPESATATAHTQSALTQARKQALAQVREDLQTKLRQRNLGLALTFPGQPANATRPPEEDDYVLREAVYLHRVTELGAIAGQGPAVEAELEVVYTLHRNATIPVERAAPSPVSPVPTVPPLPLTSPMGGTFGPMPTRDDNATQAIMRMLEQGADSLRDGLE